MSRILISCLISVVMISSAMSQPMEIAYDDGNRVFSTNLHAPQRGGVLFQPSPFLYPFRLLSVRIWFATPGTFEVHVLTGTHLGSPDGIDQVTPFSFSATETATWDTVDFQPHQIILSEDFVFAGQWTADVPQIWGDGSGSGHFWRDNGLGWFEYFAMDPLIRATIEANTGVQIELPPTPLADGFRLDGVYPNPWNSEAWVRIQIGQPQHVSLQLFDLTGRRIMTLWGGPITAGIHDIKIDGSSLTSGVYFFTAQNASGVAQTSRCVLIK